MPRTSAMPPATRFFARIDLFECECPNCGVVISTYNNAGVPRRLHTLSGVRMATKENPNRPDLVGMVWNALTQRLRCPRCHAVYIAGLLLYSQRQGAGMPQDAPYDAMPTARQRLEMRRRDAGGWWVEKLREEEVNLWVDRTCECPDRGTSRTCPIHGWEPKAELEVSKRE